jgi:hypothetical protein
MSTAPSTLFAHFHWVELLSAMVQTTSGKEDGEETPEPSNGISMVYPRQSRTTTGNLTHLTSKAMETAAMSDVPLQIQDGGNSSDMRMAI